MKQYQQPKKGVFHSGVQAREQEKTEVTAAAIGAAIERASKIKINAQHHAGRP